MLCARYAKLIPIAFGSLNIKLVISEYGCHPQILRLIKCQAYYLPLPIPENALLPILGVATVAGIVPIGAFYAGAQRLGAARAALVSTVEPVYTIVAAGILFGEQLTPTQLAGGAAILVAVLVAEWGAIRSGTPRNRRQRK